MKALVWIAAATGFWVALWLGIISLISDTERDTPLAQAPPAPLAPGLQVEPGGWHGNDECQCVASSLVFGLGEIRGVRDIQGGSRMHGDRFNALDVGAGNSDQPGRLGIGADVTGTIVYHAKYPNPAEPVDLATMTPDGTTFHAPVSFESGVYGLPITETAIQRIVRQMLRRHLRRHH